MGKRTLVINLTRFGDLLQTQPVISGLKAEGYEVGLVCLENFASAAGLLRDVDAVYGLPGAALLSGLDSDWRASLNLFAQWMDVLKDFNASQVVNLTSTLPARLLARQLDLPIKGYGVDEFGFALNATPWAAFMQATAKNRESSPFNLVDLFWKVSGLGDGERVYRLAPPPVEARQQMAAFLAEEKPEGAEGFIAMQLGASADFRRWPVEYFAAVADRVWEERRICPVLLGTSGEQELADRFRQACHAPAIVLTGRTSLTQLAAALKHMRMLVTNDTGTMHLAAGLGVPICALFLATAQPWDTGPYIEGALCMEPDMPCHPCGFDVTCQQSYACRRAVTPDVVTPFVMQFFESGTWALPAGVSVRKGVRVWETKKNADGFMTLSSHSGHDMSDRAVWTLLQREFYRQFLDETEAGGSGAATLCLSPEVRAETAEELEQVEKLFFLLLQQAGAVARAPLPTLKRKFMANYERLSLLSAEKKHLGVLGDLWREQAQDVGEDFALLPDLIEKYYLLVKHWRERVLCSGT